MENNMEIYNNLRAVPEEAKKPIGAGRLRGMTDINPMWRIKRLTEVFGPCGIGWRYEIVRQWTEPGGENEIRAFCNINLFYKYGDEWSAPIPGTGGNSFVTAERSGVYTSDECYKMALTDALSVACKALGMAGDVFYEKDRTKYTASDALPPDAPNPNQQSGMNYCCCDCGKPFEEYTDKYGVRRPAAQAYELSRSLNTDGQPRCSECMTRAGTRKKKEA